MVRTDGRTVDIRTVDTAECLVAWVGRWGCQTEVESVDVDGPRLLGYIPSHQPTTIDFNRGNPPSSPASALGVFGWTCV